MNSYLPSSLTTLGTNAFKGCTSTDFSTLSLPSGVTRIGKSAFRDDPLIMELTLPDNLTAIGDHAFRYTGIAELTIPAAVSDASSDFLYGADGLAAIHVAEGNPLFTSVDGVLFSLDGTTLLRYPPQRSAAVYTVPESTVSLADEAFFTVYQPCASLTKIILPESLTNVGDFAFGSNSDTAPGTLCFLGDAPSAAGTFCNRPADAYYPQSRAASWQNPPAQNYLTWHPFCQLSEGQIVAQHTLEPVEGTPPTCLEDGIADHFICTVCGSLFQDEEGAIPLTQDQISLPYLDHDWTEPIYTVSEDGTAITAHRACIRDGAHIEEETVPVLSSEVTLKPTCEYAGETTYVSEAFENAAFTAQTIVLPIDPLSHTPETVPGYDATCTKDGLSDEIFCAVCCQLIQEAAPVPAPGHG